VSVNNNFKMPSEEHESRVSSSHVHDISTVSLKVNENHHAMTAENT
jgi:spore germination protein GerM